MCRGGGEDLLRENIWERCQGKFEMKFGGEINYVMRKAIYLDRQVDRGGTGGGPNGRLSSPKELAKKWGGVEPP